MKCSKFVAAVAIVTAVSQGVVMAATGVKNSPHDFTTAAWNADITHGTNAAAKEMCLPCHIPHHSNKTIGYLWNHQVPDATLFTVWTNAVLGSESLTCLGCHDGVTALDNFSGTTNGTTQMTGDAVIGRDLTDSHPIGVDYGTSTRYATPVYTNGGWFVKSQWTSSRGLSLGANKRIQCTSCHTPHSNDKGDFLNVDNTGSHLCATCHGTWYDGTRDH